MNSVKINDIKITMSLLLLKDAFDTFFLEKAEVMTFAKLVLNGKRNKNWYSGETGNIVEDKNIFNEDGSYTEFVRWKEVKHIFLGYIKGKKTPDIFRVSLKADETMAKAFLNDSGYYGRYLSEKPGLHMQFRYEKSMLQVITGIYNNSFTMDKSFEKAWDAAVAEWFRKNKISIEPLYPGA